MRDVLIIDDDETFLHLMYDFLTPEGFTIRAFSSYGNALASLSAQLPNLLILDLMMPQRDGVSIYRQLRAEPATVSLPILISTAAPQHIVRLGQIHHDLYARVLPKPYRLDTLLTQIHVLMGAPQPHGGDMVAPAASRTPYRTTTGR